MADIGNILNDTSHRPWPIPQGKWQYYQEWNNAIFIHWDIPLNILKKCVPEKLTIDSFEGKYYVSLVAFTMQNIRPRNLPPLEYISNFHEINIRTYIDNDGKKGVYFLSIEAEKIISVWIAKQLSDLPYEKSTIERTPSTYLSKNNKKDFFLDIEYEIGDKENAKTELDKWLTERYSLYLNQEEKIYRYDIHHKEWVLKKLRVNRLDYKYQIGGEYLMEEPNLMHYSDGVKVVSWGRQKVL